MSQASIVIDGNQSGLGVMNDLNSGLQAITTMQAGPSAPAETYAYMLWADTSSSLLKMRNAANNNWIILAVLSEQLLTRDTNVQFVTAGGSGNTITATFANPYTAYTAGMILYLKLTANNSGAVTINVDGLGAKSLVKYGGDALVSGDLLSGMMVQAVYDGAVFVLATPVAGLSRDTTPVGNIAGHYGNTPPVNWLEMNGATLGDASSGATYLGAQYQNLYYHLWNTDSGLTVSTGRGGSAAADWAASKTIALPNARAHTLIGHGAYSGLTTRTLNTRAGEEKHLMTLAELVGHEHDANCSYGAAGNNPSGVAVSYSTSGGNRVVTKTVGGNTPFNVMQPSLAIMWIIKV